MVSMPISSGGVIHFQSRFLKSYIVSTIFRTFSFADSNKVESVDAMSSSAPRSFENKSIESHPSGFVIVNGGCMICME